MRYTNHNGHIVPQEQAAIQPDNTSFRYGIGLFETMLIRDNTILLKEYHWDRLFSGLKTLHLHVPVLMTPETLEDQILLTARKNKLAHLCRVRLQLFGGSGGIFGSDDNKLHYVIECYPLTSESQELNINGLVLGISKDVSKSPDSLSNLKSSNALVYAMAARQAKMQKCNDAIVFNSRGNIIETAIANIFWIKDGIIFTPPLDEGCVAGVMRRHLLHTFPEIVEKPLITSDLMNADEVFVSNAIKGIKWVSAIGASKYICHQITALQQKLNL